MTNEIEIMPSTAIDNTRNFVKPYPDNTPMLPVRPRVEIMRDSHPVVMLPDTGITQIVRADNHPEQRAIALLKKTSAVSGALAVSTLAAMFVLGEVLFFAWLAMASIEFCIVFVVLAMWDWKETPASQQHKALSSTLRMMELEQRKRLEAQYGRN